MDGLTLFVKMLDVLVLLVKGAGLAALVVAAAFLIKLLPSRVQKVAAGVAAALLFVALLKESWLSVYAISAIRLGIYIVTVLVACTATLFVAALVKGKTHCVVAGDQKRSLAPSRANGFGVAVQYLSSCLRQTPVMRQ